MLTTEDKKILKSKNISTQTILNQLHYFDKGFPYANLQRPALVGDGIIVFSDSNCTNYISLYEQQLQEGLDVAKFVPASGAATRMFKSLFEFIQASPEKQQELINEEPYRIFIDKIDCFAFANDLKELTGSDDSDRITHAKNIISKLLLDEGLGYGYLPKGLLKFHRAENNGITPFEEHIRETAKYCKNKNQTGKLHFTVSPEHHARFSKLMDKVLYYYEKMYNIKLQIDFSFQKPSTDTIAVNPDNTPFREENGQLLFRPGGHGALIENLNDMSEELVFIKNIDNVVPDQLQNDTVKYKKALAGLLLEKKAAIFTILNMLDNGDDAIIKEGIEQGIRFLTNELQIDIPKNINNDKQAQFITYLKDKLNRPIRVCGMVKNEGEPGGGPFWVKQADGSVSLQIVEGAQIDKNNSDQQNILSNSTYFNPVDLVCYLRNYQNHKFDLHEYIDAETGFISEKTKNGKPLKALELPGLWNGAMANWITFFVEVPISTFNPVKTVMDLLRPQHQ